MSERDEERESQIVYRKRPFFLFLLLLFLDVDFAAATDMVVVGAAHAKQD
jgi:hypothetical protein